MDVVKLFVVQSDRAPLNYKANTVSKGTVNSYRAAATFRLSLEGSSIFVALINRPPRIYCT